MRGWILCVGVAVLAASGGITGFRARAADRLAGPVAAEVLSVVDGDTLEVRAHIWRGQDVSIRVRLAGIDAPELKGRCAREKALATAAHAFLSARLGPGGGRGAEVRLRNIRYGKYGGRVLADVETALGEDLGERLVMAGLARPYGGRGRTPWCPRAGVPSSG